MTFSPPAASTGPGRTAIDVHDDRGQKVATIYATRDGINVRMEPQCEAAGLSIDQQPPIGVQFAISRRSEREGKRR